MTKREKNLLIFAVVVALVCGYVYVIQQLNTALLNAEAENSALTMEYEDVEMKISLIPTYETAVETNTQALEEAKTNIVEYFEDEEIHTLFTSLAYSCNVTPLTLSISENTLSYITEAGDETYFTAKEVSLNFTSTQEDFMNLLDELNSRTDTVVLNLSQSLNSDEYSDFTIQCVIFMQSNPWGDWWKF